MGGDNSQTEAPTGLAPPPPAPSTMETSGCGRYAPPPRVEMRLQIRCDPGSSAASPPAHPRQPRAGLLRLSGWAASPSSLKSRRNLVVGPCSPAARPWRQSLDSRCQWNQMGRPSQPQISRLKKHWQGNGATCWSLGRDPGRRDCREAPAALPALHRPSSRVAGRVENGGPRPSAATLQTAYSSS